MKLLIAAFIVMFIVFVLLIYGCVKVSGDCSKEEGQTKEGSGNG